MRAAVGVGPLSGASNVYQASPGEFIRAGIGLRRFEISAMYEDYLNFLVHTSNYACVSTCPVNYRIEGVAVGFWVNDRPSHRGGGRFQIGSGAYRVHPDHPYGLPFATTTALGVHLDGESVLYSGASNSVSLGARLMLLPSVNGERLWVLPVELRLGFW